MIKAEDGNIEINGTEIELMKDWCMLTDAIFKQMFKEDYADKLRKTVSFLIEQSNELDNMKVG